MIRHTDFPTALTRSRKLPLPVVALCGFRSGSMQSMLDSFFSNKDGQCGDAGLLRHVTS